MYVLSRSRKTGSVSELWTYYGSAFQTDGPATAKAHSENFVRLSGTTTVFFDTERSPGVL